MSRRLSDGEPVANLAAEQGLSVEALRFFVNRYYTQDRPLEGRAPERAAQADLAALEDTETDPLDTGTQTPEIVPQGRTESIIEAIRATRSVTQVAKDFNLSRARIYQLLNEYYEQNPDAKRVSASPSIEDTDDKTAEWVTSLLRRGVKPESIVKAKPSLTLAGIETIATAARYGALA